MYGIFTYIYRKNQPNVGKYTTHGSYGYLCLRSDNADNGEESASNKTPSSHSALEIAKVTQGFFCNTHF